MTDHKLLPLELGDSGETDQPATTDTGVCTLVADDSNAVALAALEQAIKDAGGTTKTTMPKIGAVSLTGASATSLTRNSSSSPLSPSTPARCR